MDFKTELQNLINKYPGMIKKVKVEFVKEIEVEPNGAPPVYNVPVTRPISPVVTTPAVPAIPPELLHVPKIDAFEMTEIRYADAPKARPTPQSVKNDDAVKKTMAALTIPKV